MPASTRIHDFSIGRGHITLRIHVGWLRVFFSLENKDPIPPFHANCSFEKMSLLPFIFSLIIDLVRTKQYIFYTFELFFFFLSVGARLITNECFIHVDSKDSRK